MNRQQLVTAISNKTTDITKKDVETVINLFVDVVTEAVANGEEVNLPNLGKFARVFKKERIGRNPQTSEEITIEAKHAPHFTIAKNFKDIVKEQANR